MLSSSKFRMDLDGFREGEWSKKQMVTIVFIVVRIHGLKIIFLYPDFWEKL